MSMMNGLNNFTYGLAEEISSVEYRERPLLALHLLLQRPVLRPKIVDSRRSAAVRRREIKEAAKVGRSESAIP